MTRPKCCYTAIRKPFIESCTEKRNEYVLTGKVTEAPDEGVRVRRAAARGRDRLGRERVRRKGTERREWKLNLIR